MNFLRHHWREWCLMVVSSTCFFANAPTWAIAGFVAVVCIVLLLMDCSITINCGDKPNAEEGDSEP